MADHSPADRWIAERMHSIESSGIRKVFELARSIKDPINLSIGQPDFDVPEPIKDAAHTAIDRGKNGYTLTQGVPELRQRLLRDVRQQYSHADRELMVTSGTSGGLVLALSCTINPGDEVIAFDPYFLLYPNAVTLAGGTTVLIDTYPDFALDIDRVREAITPRTKAILFNSPVNPTGARTHRNRSTRPGSAGGGARHPAHQRRDLSHLLLRRPFPQSRRIQRARPRHRRLFQVLRHDRLAARFRPRTATAHRGDEQAPAVHLRCAPSIVQYAGVAACDVDMSAHVAAYRHKRDFMYDALKDRYELGRPGGAFYLFPKAPRGNGTAFVQEAIAHDLLVIPGCIFSKHDSHFRISYAADERTLQRGVEVLRKLA